MQCVKANTYSLCLLQIYHTKVWMTQSDSDCWGKSPRQSVAVSSQAQMPKNCAVSQWWVTNCTTIVMTDVLSDRRRRAASSFVWDSIKPHGAFWQRRDILDSWEYCNGETADYYHDLIPTTIPDMQTNIDCCVLQYIASPYATSYKSGAEKGVEVRL